MRSLTIIIGLTVVASLAHAEPQTSGQRRCITGALKAGAKLALAQGQRNAACVKRAGKGTETAPADCVDTDDSGTLAKLAAKTVKVDCSETPDFGWAGATAVNDAAVIEEQTLVRELFGTDLDTALVTDGDAARCQYLVAKATEKLAATAVVAFRSCAKRGLADGSITSAADLAACLRTGDGMMVATVLAKKCGTVDVAAAFPGACVDADSPSDCIAERVTCRTCRMLDTMAGLDAPCDQLDDGADNASCSRTTTTTSTTTTTLPTSGGSCPTFLDVGQAPGAGGAYADPTLTVTCSDDEVTVTSNGIPHYTFVAITPNALFAHDTTYRFPRNPTLAAEPSDIPLLGTAGVAVNGMPFFGPNEAAFPDPYGDPFVNAILDGCLGHTSPGEYHYHALLEQCLVSSGLVAEPWLNTAPSGDTASPIIAYALDGFPVYGPYDCTDAACSDVVQLESSWESTGYSSTGCTSDAQCGSTYRCALTIIGGTKQKACLPRTYAWDNNAYVAKAGSQFLDRCNGHVGPNGDYHYHATDTFPYILGCYAGEL